MQTKFALRNLKGDPVVFYLVDEAEVQPESSTPTPTHHIAVLDVSGSMWGDLEDVKSVIEKVFTLEEFNDASQKISLISYSSNGDCQVHFQRVTVAEVLAPGSRHLAEIRSLTTRGLTGISQALAKAETLIDDGELTCVSLHTDGYANDPSPFTEARNILAAVQKLEKHPNVFCNTLAYRGGCDFALLDAIANRMSGSCVRVQNARQVYEALHASQTVLAGQVTPTLELGLGTYDHIAFVSQSARKVLGGTESLQVRGLSVHDRGTVYRYRSVSEAAYAASEAPECTPHSLTPVLAYARTQISLGQLKRAKYALITTRARNLIEKHIRAMVTADVAALSQDLDNALLDNAALMFTQSYGLDQDGPSVLTVLGFLSRHTPGFRLAVDSMAYQRRGVKRIAGSRGKDGVFQPADFQLKSKAEGPVFVSGIDVSLDRATINIRVAPKGVLVRVANGEEIHEVAGIPLDLKDYRQYTLVSDGQVTVPVLPIQITDKRVFQYLYTHGVLSGDFNPSEIYEIPLGQMPLIDLDGEDFTTLGEDDFKEIAEFTVVQKLLSALLKNESVSYTPDQVAALREHYITPAGYFSGPTTTPYEDLATAMGEGDVDARTTYTVRVGSTSIINLSKIPSANAYLQRRFTLKTGGDAVEKPTMDMWWGDDNAWSEKALSARTKLDAVDDLCCPIFLEFLGLDASTTQSGPGPLSRVLVNAGVDVEAFSDALVGACSKDEAVQVFQSALLRINEVIDFIYEDKITPLAFYVGSTGVLPDVYDAPAMTPDELGQKYPALKLSKAEKEGMYYEVAPNTLLGVFPEVVYYSTPKGVKSAKTLEDFHANYARA